MVRKSELCVYILKPILDDPRFEGLQYADDYPSLVGNDDLYDDFIPCPQNGQFEIPSLKKKWPNNIRVTGSVRSFNDYPGINLSKPAFSERAAECLRPFLEKSGELLPVRHHSGRFLIYNLRRMSNALKQSSARIELSPSQYPVRVEWYDFYKTRLEDEAIFRVAQCPWAVHVTEAFRQQVLNSCLNGFHFIKVWPLSDGIDWRDMEAAARKKRGKSHKLVGETLILRFRIEGSDENAKEKRALKKIESQLLARIDRQTSPNDPLYGSLGASEATKGEHRIFISCPSVDQLYTYLSDWIANIDWPGEFHIVKRWGHLMDTKAKEKRFKIW